MYVTQTSNAANASPTAATSAAAKKDVDYQSFLKLLVAQMKNQDPSDPMDATQYVAQLASFSNVEQTIQINTKLESLLQTNAIGQVDAVLGRTITSADGTVTGKVASVTLASNGLQAILEDGSQVTVQAGVKVK